MSWMQMLHATYQQCQEKIPPIYHTTQQAQIEIFIDGLGNFHRAEVITDKKEATTLIPCTEKSSGRSGSKPINHPLCDKLQYVAKDFLQFGGQVTSGYAKDPVVPHQLFTADLNRWANSAQTHPKLKAIQAYVQKGRVIEDLIHAGILPVDDAGKPLNAWEGEKEQEPAIFKMVAKTPMDAFVRWQVEVIGSGESTTWQDQSLIQCWIEHYLEQQSEIALRGTCMVSGEESVLLAASHPAKLRHAADKAKLISSNDSSGFTYRGRFTQAEQVCGVGMEATQQTHNTLRWLIERQAYRQGDLQIVAWAVNGLHTPNPLVNSHDLMMDEEDDFELPEPVKPKDSNQAFGQRLARKIRGYRTQLGSLSDIVVMGLNSATPGRMSVIFYRELKSAEFLDRLERWHTQTSWQQNFGKKLQFEGAPAPRDIAEAAYGARLDDKLKSSTVQRLLPCIMDNQPLPKDLVDSVVHRVSNRVAYERGRNGYQWEWEKHLGIACALYRGFMQLEKEYTMALDRASSKRDYLYGRLLALAEHIEISVLNDAEKSRPTNAVRLMQRFSQRPNASWLTIHQALLPYKNRMQVNHPGQLVHLNREIQEVMDLFNHDEYLDDSPLSGEYLLGYYCQRSDLWTKKSDKNASGDKA
uniref:CRISPR-associated protein, Csd1 family n=1 Tax=Magnetococcus massalia (strain MO-1) TaxID=451514 RepID=A0A1S7LE52_MAGMO|nr:Conserved protein of unknown function. CRISPR-associated protein, Csd1 family [Candidatus Magnetococcus massalia]